jgi:hypothetical protein
MDPTDHIRRARVTLLLAQAAQVVPNGTVSMLGAGATQIAADQPFAIAGAIELPWDAAGVDHKMRLELLDDQGKPVMTETDDGQQPVFIEGMFQVAPMPGLRRGTPLSMPIGINLGPQPLQPASRYEWRLELNGQAHEDWRLGFNTVPQPPQVAT